MAHWSSCAVYNEPAYPKGPCNCGNDAPERKPEGFFAQLTPEQQKAALEYRGEDC